MKARYGSALVAGIGLMLTHLPALADTVIANGLRNTSLGGADLNVFVPYLSKYGWTPDHASLQVDDLGSWGLDGVTVHLGRAEGGAYFYPYAYAVPGRFMSALSFGSVDGESGRYLAAIAGQRGDSEGQFTAWVDFGALSWAPYRYRFYVQGSLVHERTTWTRQLDFLYAWTTPRVNPCALLPDRSVAAIIDFDGSGMDVSLDDRQLNADRIEIAPTRLRHKVDYVSAVQVRGGGGLDSFGLSIVQPVAFGHPHRVLGGATARLEVEPGLVSLRRSQQDTNSGLGAWFTFPPAMRCDAGVLPVPGTNRPASVTVSALGHGRYGRGSYVGEASLHYLETNAQFTGELVFDTTQQTVILRDGIEVASTAFSTNPVPVVLLTELHVRAVNALAHTTDTLPGLSMIFDRVGTFALPDGARHDGDELRVRASTTSTMAYIGALGLTVSNLTSLIITNETVTPAVAPALEIKSVGTNIVLSWADPNRQYYLECSPVDVSGQWQGVPVTPMLMNGVATVTLPADVAEDRFYRLVLGITWDPSSRPGRD